VISLWCQKKKILEKDLKSNDHSGNPGELYKLKVTLEREIVAVDVRHVEKSDTGYKSWEMHRKQWEIFRIKYEKKSYFSSFLSVVW